MATKVGRDRLAGRRVCLSHVRLGFRWALPPSLAPGERAVLPLCRPAVCEPRHEGGGTLVPQGCPALPQRPLLVLGRLCCWQPESQLVQLTVGPPLPQTETRQTSPQEPSSAPPVFLLGQTRVVLVVTVGPGWVPQEAGLGKACGRTTESRAAAASHPDPTPQVPVSSHLSLLCGSERPQPARLRGGDVHPTSLSKDVGCPETTTAQSIQKLSQDQPQVRRQSRDWQHRSRCHRTPFQWEGWVP